MKSYDVTIQAIVTKTYRVTAESADKAVEIGHETFSVLNDDAPETYDQDLVSVEESQGDDQ